MATDNTHVPQTEDMGNAAGQEFNPDIVQIAQADNGSGNGAPANGGQGNGAQGQPQAQVIPGAPNGEVHVTVPAGQTVVRVQVAPGETIDLPFDGSLAARFGQQGNLAIKVGDQTIILLGYSEANQQAGVTLKNDKGEAIDVASVVAQTDPNLDIQTAAGPAAGPGGAQGGHLFFGFAGGNGLGGFGELGVINPTELHYTTISPDEKILVEAPPTYSITFDITGGVVNEDDLSRYHYTHNGETSGEQVEVFYSGSGNPASAGLQDQLNSFFGTYSFKSHEGNDPYDTNDNENGSQNNPPLSDNNNGIDQDREPLSSTAHVAVNFQNTPGGKLTFDHNGDTPVIDLLNSEGITSHGNPLSYALLPATATHGESIVAYYEQNGCDVVVFSLEIQQPDITTIQGNFDITFTIYGPIDNEGVNATEFDLPTTFFLTGNGSAVFTESAGSDLVFRDIDDVPELGHFQYGPIDTNGDTSGEGGSTAWGPVQYDPANLTIGLDETHGVQHTQYNADTAVLDPAGSLQQSTSQTTDDIGGLHAWYLESAAKGALDHIIGQQPVTDPTDSNYNTDANQLLIYQHSILDTLSSEFNNGEGFCAKPLGVATVCLDVSFGADGGAGNWIGGKFVGDAQAGQTLFDKDGGANATAFQLYMQNGGTATGIPDDKTTPLTPQDMVETNVSIKIDDGNGGYITEHVYAYQLDANTIIGIAYPDGQTPGSGNNGNTENIESVTEGGTGTPVFELVLNPETGELSLIQYHSVVNPIAGDANEPVNIETIDNQQLFYFRATDYDGDYVDAPLGVAIIDDAPKLTCEDVTGQVAESALWDGNRDNPSQTTVATGSLTSTVDFGADQSGHFAINLTTAALTALGNQNLTSDGHALQYTVENGNLVGYITDSHGHEHDIFSLSVNYNGDYTFTLEGNLDHPFDNNTQSLLPIDLSAVITATDSDGDSVVLNNGQFEINVQDDIPVATCRTVDGTVDESALYDGNRESFFQTTHAHGNLSSTVSFGADHHGTFSLDLNSTTLASLTSQGLTSNGHTLNYMVDGFGNLVGYTGSSAHPHDVFTLSLDSNGNYNFTLLDNLDHVAPGEGNVIGVDFSGVIKATDSDGDSIYLNSGQFEINVNDDQPVATCRTVDGTVDESALYDGNRESFWQTTYAHGNLGSTVSFGADHNGTFSIDLNGNALSNLQGQGLTSNGQALQYAVENGHLVGYVTVNGHEHDVFTLSVDQNGNFSFTLQDNLDHVGPGQGNTIDIDFSSAIKATDGDGDSIYLNNGQFEINVNDDQPVSTCRGVDGTVDESALYDGNRDNSHQTTVAHGNLGSTVDFGADHNGTFSLDLNSNALHDLQHQNLTSNGQALSYMIQGGELIGYTGSAGSPHDVFTLTLDSSGNYTFTLLDNLDHVGPGNGNTIDIDFSSAIKATDGDGDSIYLNDGQFEINVNDDTPIATRQSTDGVVDESALYDGNRENPSQTTVATGNLAAEVSFGADHNGTFSLDVNNSTLQSLQHQNLTSNGQSLHYMMQGGELVAYTGTSQHPHDVFTLTLDSSGNYTFTLLDNLDHVGPGQGNTINIDFSGIIKATDGDGDSIHLNNGQFEVTVNDDQPVATQNTVDGVVDESALYDGNRENPAQTTVSTGNLASEVSFGADHNGTFSLDLTHSTLASQNLTSNGQALHYMIHNGELIGYTGAQNNPHDVFTLTLSSSGNYTFTLLDNLDHVGQGQGDQINIDFSSVVKATDGDGDSINLNSGQFDITVNDDQPVATQNTVDGVVDESALYDGNRENNAQTTVATGNLAGEVSFGADHNGTFSLDLTNSTLASQNLTSNGQALHYMIQGGELIGYTGSAGSPHDVFTLTLDSSGNYTFTLLDNLDHVGAGQGDQINIDFSSVVKATDGDGDSINLNSGQFDVTVNDDQPIDTQNTTSASVDESALFSIYNGAFGNRDNPSQTTVATGSLSGDVSFGADHNGTFSIVLSSSALQNLENQDLSSHGQALEYQMHNGQLVGYFTDSHGFEHDVFTLSVSSNGSYSFTLLDSIDHPADGNTQSTLPIDLSSVITATDGDGDSVQLGNSQFVIDVNDDIPVLLAGSGLGSVTIDETPGHQPGTNDHIGGTNPFDGVIAGTPLEWGTSLLPVVSEIVSYGADGPAATNPLTFALQITNAVSGLHDTATGDAIILSQLPDGTVIGSVDEGLGANNPIAIAIKVNGDGTLTIAEYRAIEHPNTSNPNDSVSLASGVLSVVVTATDGDHDSVQQSVDISGKITIRDDGPSVSVTLSGAAEPTLETYDHGTIGGGTSVAAANFASLFTVTPSYGVDLPGHTTTAYTLTLLSNHSSGLSSDGSPITLSLSSDHSTVTGTTAGGETVFTVSVDSTGEVTLTQYHELDHPLPGASSDYDSQILALASNLIGLTATATATDGDGDTATSHQTVDLGGHVEFADDGPSVTVTQSDATEPTLLTHDHATIGGGHETVSADFSTMFTVTESMGADTPGTTTTTFGLTLLGSNTDSGLTSGGEHIMLSISGGVVSGITTGGETVFTISVDSNGVVSLTQDHAIDHLPSDGASSNYDSQVLSLATGLVGVTETVTATDYDGDTATGHQTVDLGNHISFADDGPTGISALALTVDEDALTAAQGHLGSPGIEGGPNDIGVVGSVSTASLAGINFGADGEGDIKINMTNLPNLTSDGHTVQYALSSDGHTLTGFIVYDSADNQISDTVNIFTLQVDPAGLSTTFTLLGPIDHADPGYGSSTTTDTEDNSVLNFTYTATDGDGDQTGGAINVTVNDDSPVASCVSGATTEVGSNPGQQTVAYELDSSNYNGSTGNEHILISAGFVDASGNLVSSMNGDTPSINTNPDSGGVYNTNGFGVSSVSDGGNGGRYDEINYLGDGAHGANVPSEAMIFKLADAGKVAVSASVDVSEFYSNEGGVGNERGAYMLYRDGVPVSGWVMFEANSSNGHETLNITGPAGGFDQIVFIGVQGSANPNGDAGSDSSDYSVHDVTFNVIDTPPVAHVAGDLNFAFGADGPGSVFLNNTGPTNLTYHGLVITNEIDNGILVGKASDGTTVYTLDIYHDQNGYHYEFDQSHPIDQLAANNGQDVSQALDFSYGVRDNDGDTTSACITITLTNHGVTVTEPDAATGADTVKEQGLPGGSHHGDGSNVCHGAITVTAPDGVEMISINGTSVSLDTSNWHNTDITTPDGTLSITGWNPATGELDYTYTLTHNTSGDNTTDSFSVVVTDNQGDHNPASSLVISIVDDVPVAVADNLTIGAGDFNAHAGNVITALNEDGGLGTDTPGADGATVTSAYGAGSDTAVGTNTVIHGTYGDLTISSDGSYSYARNPNTAGGVDDVFHYTLTDGDGDQSSTTLTIHIGDSTPHVTEPAIGTAADTVYEAGLAGGSGDGGTQTTATGTISVNSPDGVHSIQIGTTTIPLDGSSVQINDGTRGTLTAHWDATNHQIDYSYTLLTNYVGASANDGHNVEAQPTFAVTVTDLDGDTNASSGLTINIVDDKPFAHDDGTFTVTGLNSNSTPELSFAAHSGHGLLDNDTQGADGAAITSVHYAGDNSDHAIAAGGSTTFAVGGGEVTVHSDGSWSFDQTSAVSSGVTDSFTYTLTDADGDTSTATFTIDPFVNQNKPTAVNDEAAVHASVSGVSPNYNVLLVLDLSLSMDQTVANSGGKTRLQVEQAALQQLIQQYESLSGHVNIQIETFGVTASTNGITYSSDGSAGHTLQDAINYVNGFTNSNLSPGTNYDAAIGGPHADSGVTGSAYNIVSNWPASSSTTQNTVYFISDGLPQSGSGTGSSAGSAYLISSQQQTDWDNLLGTKGTSSYAVGIDLGSNPTTYLQQVADPNDATHVITTGSVDLGGVLGSIAGQVNTVSGFVLANDKDGGDGYHSPNPVETLTHDGHTYAWDGSKFTTDGLTSVAGSNGVVSFSGEDLVIATHDGGVLDFNFQTGAYNYTAPVTTSDETETFTYTIGDAVGNDTSTATLSIHVTGTGPVAYDNLDQAVVTTSTTVEANFDGSGWAYTTTGKNDNVDTPTGNNPVQSVSDLHWGVVTGGSGSSVTETGSGSAHSLQIVDTSASGTTSVATPGFTVPSGTASASLSFDLATTNNGTGDSVAWTVYKLVSGSWVAQVLTSSTSGNTITVTGLTGGSEYRLVVSATDNTGSNGKNLTVSLDNINLTTTAITSATGNVLTDPMNNPNSLDPWGGTDVAAAAAAISIDGVHFTNIASGSAGTTIDGTYGDLTIHTDGSYTYTPHDANSVGHSDTFTYQVTDGTHTDMASLTLSTGTTALVDPTPHVGTDNNDTITSSDQVILGHNGDDTITGTSSTGQHLEGNGGNDHLIGGAGNDFLIGGDGNDILEGHGGFNQYSGGSGNDTIIIDPTSTDLSDSHRHIDGGSGYDTLDLSAVSSWDFTGANHQGITSIEQLALTDAAHTSTANTVTLDAQSVLDMSSNNTMVISADSNDSLHLSNATGAWTAGEQGIVNPADGRTYDAYSAQVSGHTVTVLVDEHIQAANLHVNS